MANLTHVTIDTPNEYGAFICNFKTAKFQPMELVVASENYWLGKRDKVENPKTVCRQQQTYSIISTSGDTRTFVKLPFVVTCPIGTWQIDEMLQILDNWASDYMLPFHYIGNTDGDGSAFGIWFNWEWMKDELKYEGWEKDGENYTQGNDRVNINERENVTYYRNGKELFSYC